MQCQRKALPFKIDVEDAVGVMHQIEALEKYRRGEKYNDSPNFSKRRYVVRF